MGEPAAILDALRVNLTSNFKEYMKLYLILAALLAGCSPKTSPPNATGTLTCTSTFTSTSTSTLTGTSTATSTTTSTSTSTNTDAYVPDQAMISKAVTGSQCSKYAFGNRGPAPLGYLKGVATSYARTLCFFNSPAKTYAGTVSKAAGDDAHDALVHYGIAADKGSQRIKQTYTLLIGLGLRESSGQYGEGWDRSKLPAIQPTAVNSETGAFQVSYDNNSKMPASAALYVEYQAHPDRCDLNVFKEGSKAVKQDFVGSGPGYDFQKFLRYCPALQVDYAAAGIRVNRGQWGPLNRKEAEYYKPCEDVLSKVETQVKCQ